jgi:hypothetical protein
MCSKSNPIVVFALDLVSTYEGEHMIFGLLGQANFTQNDVLHFHPFTSMFLLFLDEESSFQDSGRIPHCLLTKILGRS